MKIKTYYLVGGEITTNEFAAIQTGELLRLPVWREVVSPDPVFRSLDIWDDGGWEYVGRPPHRPYPIDERRNTIPPVCEANCVWRQSIKLDKQNNSLRCETSHLVDTDRCGWNLKPNTNGRSLLDFGSCTFSGENNENIR